MVLKNLFFNIQILMTIFSSIAYSQNKTIHRNFVPIIQETKDTALEGLVIEEWQAYRFDSTVDSWTQILYQVDEKSPDGKYNKLELMDGVIGPYDEFLVMPADLGDKAPVSSWIEGIGPSENKRWEIKLAESESGESGWIYLFKKPGLEELKGHFTYIEAPASAPAADTVITDSYKIGHSNNGWMEYASLSINNNMDLLDRLKLRLAGDPIPIFSDFVFSENSLEAQLDAPKGPVTFIPGSVRSFQDRRNYFQDIVFGVKTTGDYQVQYFPYSFRITLDKLELNKTLIATAGVQNLRISLDLNSNSQGMTFFSANNLDGHAIDGVPDDIDVPLNPAQKNQWVMATGEAGSFLLIMEMPEITNAKFDIYYRDNNSGGTNDETDDTGDGVSYSDMGLWLHVDDGHLNADFLSIKYNAYFINESNLTPNVADQIAQWETIPLNMTVTEQSFELTFVSYKSIVPEKFQLSPAYPNPFKLGSGDIQFKYKNGVSGETVQLLIYNILGQKIAQQSHTITETLGVVKWDGKYLSGKAASAGVYFYQLETLNETYYGKLFINR
jgi:hypothetical protein